jgi:hypothetical protein
MSLTGFNSSLTLYAARYLSTINISEYFKIGLLVSITNHSKFSCHFNIYNTIITKKLRMNSSPFLKNGNTKKKKVPDTDTRELFFSH